MKSLWCETFPSKRRTKTCRYWPKLSDLRSTGIWYWYQYARKHKNIYHKIIHLTAASLDIQTFPLPHCWYPAHVYPTPTPPNPKVQYYDMSVLMDCLELKPLHVASLKWKLCRLKATIWLFDEELNWTRMFNPVAPNSFCMTKISHSCPT